MKSLYAHKKRKALQKAKRTGSCVSYWTTGGGDTLEVVHFANEQGQFFVEYWPKGESPGYHKKFWC